MNMQGENIENTDQLYVNKIVVDDTVSAAHLDATSLVTGHANVIDFMATGNVTLANTIYFTDSFGASDIISLSDVQTVVRENLGGPVGRTNMDAVQLEISSLTGQNLVLNGKINDLHRDNIELKEELAKIKKMVGL